MNSIIGAYCLNCYEISMNYCWQGTKPMISLSLQIHNLTFSDGKKVEFNRNHEIQFQIELCIWTIVTQLGDTPLKAD